MCKLKISRSPCKHREDKRAYQLVKNKTEFHKDTALSLYTFVLKDRSALPLADAASETLWQPALGDSEFRPSPARKFRSDLLASYWCVLALLLRRVFSELPEVL